MPTEPTCQRNLHANGTYMPTEFLKMSYIQGLVADNALAQISSRLDDDATRPFTTAKEMPDVLTASFGNINKNFEKQEARGAYRFLCQGTRDFSSFWAEFQRFTQELDHSEATLIDELIEKSHYSIRRKLATAAPAEPTVTDEAFMLMTTLGQHPIILGKP